jgi:exonuclease SbcD
MWILFVGNPDVTIPTAIIENGFEITLSENGFRNSTSQYEFPIRIITTPYANESRLKRYLGAENKEEQLNQLLQDSWAANKY